MKYLTIAILFIISSIFLLLPVSAQENPLKRIFEEATKSYVEHDFKRAILLYEKTLELYPNFAPSYNYLGLVHRELGEDPRQLIWYFKKSIEIDPQYADPYLNLGKMYYGMGEFEKAEEFVLKANKIKPGLADADMSLAWIYLVGKEDAQRAIPLFKKALKVNNSSFNVYGLGVAYLLAGKNAEVLGVITQLRKSSTEVFAAELEGMLRDHRHVMPANLRPQRQSSSEQPQVEKPVEIKDNFDGNVPVRLHIPSPVNIQKLPEDSLESTMSGEERIRALQQRGSNL